MARARQTAMGREYARQLRGETVALENEAVRSYVDRVGRMLAAQMPGPQPSWEFTVAEMPACPAAQEPAALPGGFVFFPARLLAASRNESEFAAVVAHAVAHEVLHRMPVAAPEGSPAIPLVMLGGWTSDCRGRQSVPIGFAAALKKQEQDADALAWKALEAAGFDPRAVTSSVQRRVDSAATDAQRGEQEERLAALRALETAASPARQDSVEVEAARAEIRRFVEAQSPARRAPSLVRAKQP
ncbi:M48 family metalloprotease [Paludibaculum fermentans]|uniref:M48 family metalloprotease n=1 Tax=Paludibaculum fermentans TaxID=1473598 RepID=A0A7S7SPE5_PALFE|nr:M48 family metalloprotease [Paludibaculum fermentans]QOY91838.1 M48 family metalloprotease [Paludibaculum fermentans]